MCTGALVDRTQYRILTNVINIDNILRTLLVFDQDTFSFREACLKHKQNVCDKPETP